MNPQLIRGLAGLTWQLDTLTKNIERRMMRAALRRGATVFREEIKTRIETLPISAEGKKVLRRSLVLRPYGKEGVGVFFRSGWQTQDGRALEEVFRSSSIRVAGGGSRGEAKGLRYIALDDAYFWRWIEFGTAARSTKKGWARGAVPEMPFIRPAIEAAESRALAAIQDSLQESIDELIRESGVGP